MDDSSKLKFVQEKDAVAFDPVEFGLSLHFIFEMSQKVKWPPNVDKGRSAEASFTLAAVNRYRNDTIKALSFVYRWGALMRLIDRGGIDEHLYRRDQNVTGFSWIHDSVVQVAATIPLSQRGEFTRAAFSKALKRAPLKTG